MSTYTETTISLQGDEHQILEVYADETMEQTIAFCWDEEQANLIAAAPALLEVCKDVRDQFKDLRDAIGDTSNITLIEAKIKDAIAKAEVKP